MTEEKKSNKDNFKNAICYIPFVALFLFFKEENKSQEYKKHIKYGIFLLIAYVFITFFLGLFFGGGLKSLITLAYFGISGYLGYKAYKGDEIELEVFDEIEKNVKEKIDDENKNEKK